MTAKTDNTADKTSSITASRRQVSFSVIMPAYNRKYCIDQAIQSVLSQNYGCFELLIVDDGSTDGTTDHIKATYTEEIKKGKIILIPSGKVGCAGARNIGLNHAKNDWICYLDTDNRMMLNYFDTFNGCILENPGYQCFYAKMRLRKSGQVFGMPFSFFELLQSNFIDTGIFVHSSALYRELGGPDVSLKSLEDWDLAIRYTARHKPYFIDDVVLDYNDVYSGDRMSEDIDLSTNNAPKIMDKNILVNVDFLAKNLHPPESLKWALKHLLKVSFYKIRNIFRGCFFR